MAYTKAPSVATNSAERFDFIYNPQQRDARTLNKDARLVNMMVEVLPSPNKENTRAFVKSRPGMSVAYTVTGGLGRGLYNWVFNNTSYIVAVSADKVTVNGVLRQTLTTTTGVVGFTEHVDSLGIVRLFMCDGTKGYVWGSPIAAPTLITDVNFPSPHIPMPIFLDGYIFVAKKDTQDVYNSQLDLPLSWSEGGSGGPMYISAEMYPDTIKALSKNNNYIYAIGRGSIEYLYDAATSTGSPLARENSAVQQFGTPSPASVVQTEKEVILIGETGNGGHTVWTINGFKENDISTPSIRNILLEEGANLATAVGNCVRVSGQKLYILVLSTRTIVYSFDTQMWSEWRSGFGGTANFYGNFLVDGLNGGVYVLISSGINICTMNQDIYTDLGNPINCVITTPKYDFGTYNRKTMSRFVLVGDNPTALSGSNLCKLEWSDDDYSTWSGPRYISFQYDFPGITQLGAFRRRAFRLTYDSEALFRLDGAEVDINKGTQ